MIDKLNAISDLLNPGARYMGDKRGADFRLAPNSKTGGIDLSINGGKTRQILNADEIADGSYKTVVNNRLREIEIP